MNCRVIASLGNGRGLKQQSHQNQMSPTYLPAADAQFNDWIVNFSTLLTASPSTYSLAVPDAIIVAGVTAGWAAAYLLAIDPGTRTSVTVATKDAARASAEVIVRPYAVGISLNPGVSNGDKVDIGVTVRSNIPTPIPAPVTPPTISLISATPLVHQLMIRPVGSSSKAKPAGCIATEVARSVGTVAATDPAQLSIIGQYGKTPLIQSFAAQDQGKICTYAARFRTRSGPGGVSQAGPWSALTSYVVI